MMRLLDSNIIIYASKPGFAFLRPMVLGYHMLSEVEKEDLEDFFGNTPILPASPAVLDEAVKLRQQRKMKLADALIAATALLFRCTLLTRNISDSDWVPQLSLADPFVNS